MPPPSAIAGHSLTSPELPSETSHVDNMTDSRSSTPHRPHKHAVRRGANAFGVKSSAPAECCSLAHNIACARLSLPSQSTFSSTSPALSAVSAPRISHSSIPSAAAPQTPFAQLPSRLRLYRDAFHHNDAPAPSIHATTALSVESKWGTTSADSLHLREDLGVSAHAGSEAISELKTYCQPKSDAPKPLVPQIANAGLAHRDSQDATRVGDFAPVFKPRGSSEEIALKRIAEYVGPGDYLTIDQLIQQTQWTRTMCDRLTLRRLSEFDPEDTMYSTGVIDVLRSGEVVVMREGRIARSSAQGIDIFNDMQRLRKDIEGQIFLGRPQPPGFDCIVSLLPQLRSPFSRANFFPNASRPCRLEVKQLVLPEIFTPEDLAWYGFALCSVNKPVRLLSPAGCIPVLPLFVGRNYHRNIRGGLFIEKHGAIAGSIHLWIPMNKEASGFVLAARQVSAAPYRLRFGKICIPYGSMLVCSASGWHCDGTLSGGVYLSSFGYPQGARTPEDHNVVTLQPLVNRSDCPIILAP